MGVLVALRLDVPNFIKAIKRVSKCIPRWGHLPVTFEWVPNELMDHR